VVVLFVQAKRDDPTKPRRILDARDRNEAVDLNHTPLPSIEELMELVAAVKYWSKIDLADGYHNIRIEEDSEKHSTFLTNMEITAVASCNKATATRLPPW